MTRAYVCMQISDYPPPPPPPPPPGHIPACIASLHRNIAQTDVYGFELDCPEVCFFHIRYTFQL